MAEQPDPNASTYADVAKTGIAALTPGSSGWVLALVILVAMLTFEDYLSSRAVGDAMRELITKQYELTSEEHNKAMGIAAEQMRRSQETLRELADALGRQSDRTGRAAAAAVDRVIDKEIEDKP